MPKARADLLLVERGLAPSRTKAQALILAGKVFIKEQRVDKAGDLVDPDAPIEVRGPDHPFVSRGGVKLAGALDAFDYGVGGKVVADIGASTGGFTDCVLQRGASRVYAIDVGYGQLDDRLRNDPRVVVMERTNARHLKPGDIAELVDLVVIDASFIGLDKLLPAALGVLKPDGDLIALVKPQFEVGPDKVGKGGVVRDQDARLASIDSVIDTAKELGLGLEGRGDSVIQGPKGNQETFVWLSRRTTP